MTQNAIAPLTARFVALRRERATFERTYKAQAYPETFKRLVLELYRDLSQLDLTDYQIARKLRVHIETLRRWDKAAPANPTPPRPSPPAPLPVTVRVEDAKTLLPRPTGLPLHEPASPQSLPAPSPRTITLVAPGGWRLENLDLEQAIVVLDKLAGRAAC